MNPGEEQELPNNACTGRRGVSAFFELFSELWRFPVPEPGSRPPQLTRAVGQANR